MRTFTCIFLLSATLFSSASRAQYCMLPGRTPYSSIQPGIKIFKLGTIDRTSSNVESMSTVMVNGDDTAALLRGHTYTVTIFHNRDSITFPTTRNNIRVWVDYNSNSSFDDAGETVISSDFQAWGYYTNTFTVPLTAPLGYKKLRATAKMSSDAGHSIPTSCDVPADPIGYHGEMEDYVVNILPTTGLDAPALGFGVSVFPNPTTGSITITFDGAGNEAVKIDLLDVTGKVIGNLLDVVSPVSSYNFDLQGYAPGMYIIRVSSAVGATYHKVIKAN